MILLLHGGDTYRSKQKLHEIKEKFKREVDPQGYNLSYFEGANTEIEKLIQSLHAAPFMANKRMIVVEDILALSLSDEQKEALENIMSDLLESETIFVIYQEVLGKRDQKNSLIKVALSSPYVMEFAEYNQAQIAGWVSQQLSNSNIKISQSGLQQISLSVQDQMWKAASEVDKLVNFAKGKSIDEISDNDIKILVSSGSEDNMFGLVDAVMAGNLKLVLQRLQDQLSLGDHPLQVLSLLMRQFRILQQIKDGQAQGKSANDIASLYKIHPFVVKKISYSASKLPQAAIKKGYEELISLDKQIKSSGIDPGLLMQASVIKICQAVA